MPCNKWLDDTAKSDYFSVVGLGLVGVSVHHIVHEEVETVGLGNEGQELTVLELVFHDCEVGFASRAHA